VPGFQQSTWPYSATNPQLTYHNPCASLHLTTRARPCFPTHLVSGALHRVKRETGESSRDDESGAAPATVSERSVRSTVPTAWEGDT
jgi:hypothetical protein